MLQLRKAIEDVNNGVLLINQTSNETAGEPEQEKQPLSPQEVPLLNNGDLNAGNSMISSTNSTLSNSDNCSDIELGQVDAHRIQSK